jgi:hypothetical protein
MTRALPAILVAVVGCGTANQTGDAGTDGTGRDVHGSAFHYWARTYDAGSKWGTDVTLAHESGFIVSTESTVMRLDESGNVVWARQFPARLSGTTPIPEGGYLVTGMMNDFWTDGEDLTAVRLDEDGNVEWQKTYALLDIYEEPVRDVVGTEDGGFVLVGSAMGYSAAAVCVLKLSGGGFVEWAAVYENGEHTWERVFGVVESDDGGLLVAGVTDALSLYPGTIDNDVLVLELDGAGSFLAARAIHADYGVLEAYDCERTDDGGYLVVGGSRRDDLPAGPEAFVMKLDGGLNILWARTYGGSAEELLRAILVTEDGYVLTGRTESFGEGGSDIWLLGLSGDGEPEWQRTFGGPAEEDSFAIEGCRGAGFIIAGSTLSFSGNEDLWVLRTDEGGWISPTCPTGISRESGGSVRSISLESVALDLMRVPIEIEATDLTHPAVTDVGGLADTQCGQ